MVVDFHRHLWSVLERYPQVRAIAKRSATTQLETRVPEGFVPDADDRMRTILSDMSLSEVNKTVLFVADYGLRLGEGDLPILRENEMIADLGRAHPKEIVTFFGIDPRRPDAAASFEKAIREWGMTGLKMHPAVGFRPSDEVCYPLYEVATRWGVPVAIHTGPMASPLLSEGTQPVWLDRVAADFPDLTLIMQHAGQFCWWREAVEIAFWKPNIWLELSMWQWIFNASPASFIEAIGIIKARIGLERVLFGSDFPGLSRALPLADWINCFRSLPKAATKHSVSITEEDVANILGHNANRILDRAQTAVRNRIAAEAAPPTDEIAVADE